MDILKLLKQDHDEAKRLFNRIEKAEGDERDELFSALKDALQLHATIEESLFYPALKEHEKCHELVLESIEEHRIVKQLLQELESGEKDEQWEAKFTVLRENVEHHVKEEETELFPKAEKILGKDGLKAMGEQAMELKEEGEMASR